MGDGIGVVAGKRERTAVIGDVAVLLALVVAGGVVDLVAGSVALVAGFVDGGVADGGEAGHGGGGGGGIVVGLVL